MGGSEQGPVAVGPRFSPDGLWWWDGGQWRPALSPDGLWRWDGRAWVPARPAPPAQGAGGGRTALVVTIATLGGVLLLAVLLTLLLLYAMGDQITNVFSNVTAALDSTPSP